MKKEILFLAALCLYTGLLAQEQNSYRFKQLLVKDGLASQQVKRVYQDRTGFIWFCTSNGLQRFDGKNFKTFYSNSKDTNCLPADDINDIRQDKFGRFWIATVEKGLCVYDPEKNSFTNFNEKRDSLFSGDGDNFAKIAFTQDGETALITGYNGLYSFNVRTLSYRRFRTDNSKIFHNQLTDILNIQDDLFLISTGRGISLFDARKNIFYDETNAPIAKKLLAFSRVGAGCVIAKDHRGNFWFSLWTPGFYCYRPADDSITEIRLDANLDNKKQFNNLVNCILPDESGNFYLTTYGVGVFYLNTETGKISPRFINDPNDPNSLISPYISSLFIDREKNTWVCTAEGVSFLPYNNKLVFLALNNKKVKYTPSALLQSSDGHLWVGTYSGHGLFELDQHFKEIKNYTKFRDATDFNENAIWELAESRNGHILICRQNGFSSIHAKTGKQDDYTDVPFLTGTAITSVREDERNRWWMATWSKNLVCFDPATRRSRAFRLPGISQIAAIDKSKLLLIVYDQHYKFYTFDTNDTLLHREPYYFFNAKYPGLTHAINDMQAVVFEQDQRYIISRHGLYAVDNSNGKTAYYSRSEGLPSTVLESIIRDNRGRIWIGTRQGLSLFNQATGTFRNFNEDERLSNQEFQTRTMLQLRNGLIVSANLASLVLFNPDSLLFYKPLVPPVITQLRIGNNDITPGTASALYRVSYRNNNIAIGFASLDFAHTSSIMYAYKLEGFDKEWQYAGPVTKANYTNLDGGNYSFIVKASANGVDWVEAKTRISLFVTAPFYKQAWFMMLLVVFVLGILYLFYHIRIQRILEMQRLRNNISKDLHDDVGATMTSISILSEVVSQKIRQHEIHEANGMMEQIGNSSRTLLQNLDDIIWSINPHNDPIEKVVLRMKELTAEMMEPNRIQYHIAFDQNLGNIAIPMKDRRHLFLIYKEALHNMIKYAGCNNAFLSMYTTGHTLVLKIEDDGKGFDPQKTNTGNGLLNMRQRAEEMHAALTINSLPGKGATILLQYPLN